MHYSMLNDIQWDLGEFDQKGMVRTRWGSKEELLRACHTAKQVKVDVIVDAVINVCESSQSCVSRLTECFYAA